MVTWEAKTDVGIYWQFLVFPADSFTPAAPIEYHVPRA